MKSLLHQLSMTNRLRVLAAVAIIMVALPLVVVDSYLGVLEGKFRQFFYRFHPDMEALYSNVFCGDKV